MIQDPKPASDRGFLDRERYLQEYGIAEARAAARWWADRLTEHVEASNREEIPSYRAVTATPEQVEVFRTVLEATVLEKLRGDPEESWDNYDNHQGVLYVDYEPKPILWAALEAAKIGTYHTHPLPRKTSMYVRIGEVRVSWGYAAEFEDVPLTPLPHPAESETT